MAKFKFEILNNAGVIVSKRSGEELQPTEDKHAVMTVNPTSIKE